MRHALNVLLRSTPSRRYGEQLAPPGVQESRFRLPAAVMPWVANSSQMAEFLRFKRHYDPSEVFQSDWYRHYKKMFSDRL